MQWKAEGFYVIYATWSIVEERKKMYICSISIWQILYTPLHDFMSIKPILERIPIVLSLDYLFLEFSVLNFFLILIFVLEFSVHRILFHRIFLLPMSFSKVLLSWLKWLGSYYTPRSFHKKLDFEPGSTCWV